jgi:hypothetical protein
MQLVFFFEFEDKLCSYIVSGLSGINDRGCHLME